MKVNNTESIAHPEFPNHFIQFGISTWAEDLPESEQEESIRRAVYNQDGVFSPHGSPEIPLNEMGMLFRRCLELDKMVAYQINFVAASRYLLFLLFVHFKYVKYL